MSIVDRLLERVMQGVQMVVRQELSDMRALPLAEIVRGALDAQAAAEREAIVLRSERDQLQANIKAERVMTSAELLEYLPSTATEHPAWEAFVAEMADCQYGYDPANQAWAFFRKGWEAAAANAAKLAGKDGG